MGVAYAKAQNLEKAIYYFKRLRRQYPKSTKPLEAIIKVAHEAEQPRLAEMTLKDESKSHPRRLDTFKLLATLLLNDNREDEALTILRNAVKKNPQNIEAYKMLARFQLNQKDPTGASETFEKYASINNDKDVFQVHAQALIKQGFHKHAIELIHKRLQFEGALPEYLRILHMALLKTQQIGKAYFAQKLLIRREPNDKEIKKNHLELRTVFEQRRSLSKSKGQKSAS